MLVGVLQGDTLAQYIFTIVLDYIMRKIYNFREDKGFQLKRRRSRRVTPIVIIDHDFTDDIVLLTKEIDQAQIILDILQEEAGK